MSNAKRDADAEAYEQQESLNPDGSIGHCPDCTKKAFLAGYDQGTADERERERELVEAIEIFLPKVTDWIGSLEDLHKVEDALARERDELKFELESKQRPLSEQVLALTVERDRLTERVRELEAQVESLRVARDIWTKNDQITFGQAYLERNALNARIERLERALEDAPHAPLCAGLGGYGYCSCFKRALEGEK